MKLFDEFDVVRFPEENLLLVTENEFIYYIYNLKYKCWNKYDHAGNICITIGNYEEVSKEEIIDAMNGVFPRKETDFMRLCCPSQLHIGDMIDLLNEDYPEYMSDRKINFAVHRFLSRSDICYKSFLNLKKLFDNSLLLKKNSGEVLKQIKELCISVIGRDIFKREIGIVDGHDSSSYFWIMPVRVIDYEDTDDIDNVAAMVSIEISIEEDDVDKYLSPFLYKYFDNELEANIKRVENCWEDDDGNECFSYRNDFEWYLTYNFYSFDSVTNIIKDINDTIDALLSGNDNEFTIKLKEKQITVSYESPYSENPSAEQTNEYNTETELIVDFYRRFIYRIEYMMRVGEENGYDLISFMGP